MTQEQEFKLIPSIPSNPHSEGKIEKSTENTSFTSVPEYLPQGEGCEGCEGLAVKDSQLEEGVSEFSETFSDKMDMDDLPLLVKDAADTQEDLEEGFWGDRLMSSIKLE